MKQTDNQTDKQTDIVTSMKMPTVYKAKVVLIVKKRSALSFRGRGSGLVTTIARTLEK